MWAAHRRVVQEWAAQQVAAQGVAKQGADLQAGGESLNKGIGGDAVGGSRAGEKETGEAGETTVAPNRLGEDGVGGQRDALSPVQFLLNVMKDPAATPRQRIRAARAAARYQHALAVPDKMSAMDKMSAVDEYGFAISPTLAMEIKEDWLALDRLDVSSKAAPERAEIRARQAQRDEFLQCPPGYSAERDVTRRDELLEKRGSRSTAEETELAHVIARITAAEAAFYRSPEGKIQRRIEDLAYRRAMANKEGKRGLGLTRAEGKELDELHKQHWLKPVTPSRVSEYIRLVRLLHFSTGPASRVGKAASGIDPDSEMEELGEKLVPSITETLKEVNPRPQNLGRPRGG